jgi:hypothetical protein
VSLILGILLAIVSFVNVSDSAKSIVDEISNGGSLVQIVVDNPLEFLYVILESVVLVAASVYLISI